MNTTATPKKSNIRKLAELICATGNADRIMAVLELVLTAGALAPSSAPSAPSAEKGGEKA